MDFDREVRKKLNADEKRAFMAGAVQRFMKLYARKAQKGIEPNDRQYDRALENKIKKMRPEQLDDLLRDDEEQA